MMLFLASVGGNNSIDGKAALHGNADEVAGGRWSDVNLVHGSPHLVDSVGEGVISVAGLGEANTVTWHDVYTAVDWNHFHSVVSFWCESLSEDLHPGASALAPYSNADSFLVDEYTRELDESPLAHEFEGENDVGGIFGIVGLPSAHASSNTNRCRGHVALGTSLVAVLDHPERVVQAFSLFGIVFTHSVICIVVSAL